MILVRVVNGPSIEQARLEERFRPRQRLKKTLPIEQACRCGIVQRDRPIQARDRPVVTGVQDDVSVPLDCTDRQAPRAGGGASGGEDPLLDVNQADRYGSSPSTARQRQILLRDPAVREWC